MRNLILVLCLISILTIIPKHSDAKISDSDIIALWTFDKGNGKEAIDITGHGHDGTFDLGATVGPGKFGSGAQLDGVKGQVIIVKDDDALNVTKELSIVAWVKWNKGGVGNRFDGTIDEVGLFNRALTPDEVIQTMDGFDRMLAVKPNGKLSTTWGILK